MSMLRSSAVLAAFLSFLLTGCMHRTMQQMPATMTTPGIVILSPDQVASKDKIAKALTQVAADYRTNADAGKLDQAKIFRNRFVFTIMGQIDASYGNFERSFRTKRAAIETISDAAILGLTAATAVVGEAGIKDMLSAAVTAGTGTRLSAEKNFFNDEGTIALLTQMRASRATIEAQIIKRCANDVTQYSLEEAWKDLNHYVNAGSIESAMVQIAADTGNKNTVAQKQVSDAIDSVTNPVTKQDLIDARKAMVINGNLTNAIQPTDGSAPDPAKVQQAAKAVTDVLTSVGVTPPAGTTPANLLALLQTELDAAPANPALKAKLLQALSAVPAQFGGTGQ
jgi:hypothetical protein